MLPLNKKISSMETIKWTSAFVPWPCICFAIGLFLLNKLLKKSCVNSKKLPPGPPGWPVIGNLLDLGAYPHHSLANLCHKYGPVMWLRLGSVNAMVVSSAEAAMDMFKNHDHSFAGRISKEALKVHNFEQGSMVMAQYGPYWRMLRRMYTTEIFSKNQVNQTENLRAKCVEKLISWVSEEAKVKGIVQIRSFVELIGFNVIGSVTLSKENVVDPESKEGADFLAWTNEAIEWVGKANVVDSFPILRSFDPQSIKKNVTRIVGNQLNFAAGFVRERILQRDNGLLKMKKDFLDVMLEFESITEDGEPRKLSEENISILVTELFITSTDTTASTIEWAMTELLKNPEAMRNLREELDQIVGLGNKVEEKDIPKLDYLQAVVKETLRLHPPAPLLVPRRAMEDCEFRCYSIPKDTQVFVNVWAIGRDPISWDDPLCFKPERFLGSTVDYQGHNYQFLPFGGGRRMCVGVMLAHRMLHLVIGSLVHCFEWALENGVTPEKLDMSEMFGITTRKRKPLTVLIVKDLRLPLTGKREYRSL